MSAVQLNFTIRTSSKCKTVHLVGSWDNYRSNLPLNKDSSKSGSWKGTFRFTPPTLLPGGRYWNYYMIDGFQVSHDPARDYTVEPTTGRKLNVLDIPRGKSSSSRATATLPHESRHARQTISGRSLSPSQIKHPLPSRPYETHLFRGDAFSAHEMEALARQYASQRLSSSELSDSDTSSQAYSGGSTPPSFGSRGSGSTSPSSVSSLGSPVTPGSTSGSPQLSALPPEYQDVTFKPGSKASLGFGTLGDGGGCNCNRWAVMTSGERARLNCGGAVSGSSGSEQGCDSSIEEERRRKKHSSRHHSSRHKSSSKRSGKSKR